MVIEKIHYNIRVIGGVQGVFFRNTTKQGAQKLGIQGFVRNEPNGSVYIEAEAEEDMLDEFIKWLENGAYAAKIEKIEKSIGTMKNFTNFDVREQNLSKYD